jgi:hypothetical protein
MLIVAANVLRHTRHCKDFGGRVDLVLFCNASVDFQGRALTGILAYERKPL